MLLLPNLQITHLVTHCLLDCQAVFIQALQQPTSTGLRVKEGYVLQGEQQHTNLQAGASGVSSNTQGVCGGVSQKRTHV
jgi:hypothetical protein